LVASARVRCITGTRMKEAVNWAVKYATPAASDKAQALELLQEQYDSIEQRIEVLNVQISTLGAQRQRLIAQQPDIN
ncbi:proline/betaine transporter, partial [Plesiomonas shigelloides]|nr:proline/betaine transporter [Plesiomonas shigelloides]